MDVTRNYSSSSFSTATTSPYYVLNNYADLAAGTKLVLGTDVTLIGEYAFCSCKSLVSVAIPASVTSIGERAFYVCSSLASIEIPASVTSIGPGAFYNCPSLTSIEIPASVTSIGNDAFSYCTSLALIEIPASVTSIGTYAFYNCTSLTEINFNATAMADLSTNNYVFYQAGKNSSGITVHIGANVTRIPAYLFRPYSNNNSYVPKITTVTFADGSQCTSIGNSAFYVCSKLTSITIPASVESIGDDAFNGCDALTSITIPSSVTSIGDKAFQYCYMLTSVTIPASVTSIGSYAFAYTSISNITFMGTVSQWNTLPKGSFWNLSIRATYVQCSDGQVKIIS